MSRKQEGILNTGGIKQHIEVLNRHLYILKTLQENEPIGITNLSELTNIPSYLVRCSLITFRKDGIVKPTHVGTVTTDTLDEVIINLKAELKKIIREVNKIIQSLE
jgi:predicted transcriptional regulator